MQFQSQGAAAQTIPGVLPVVAQENAPLHTPSCNIRILCLHLAPHRPSYRYRVAQFLPHWKEHRIDIDTLCVSGNGAPANLFRLLAVDGKWDYIWIQRKLFPALLLRLLARRAKLIFDFDDAIYVRQVTPDEKPKPSGRMKLKRIANTLEKSAMVFAGSEELKSYAERFNRRVHLVPTAYRSPREATVRQEPGKQVTIGWIGNTSNLHYLGIVDEALIELKARHPHARFSVMSGRLPAGVRTPWELSAWSSEDERHWLSQIDIGIMPLSDDEWSRGKCAFKLLQYMAHGKPVVASDVGANRSVVDSGINGFLAGHTGEWVDALERLVVDERLRRTMGSESRKLHIERYERSHVQKMIASLILRDYHRSHFIP
jgi:glycosyltransferase involved in cell wall biosynthesis